MRGEESMGSEWGSIVTEAYKEPEFGSNILLAKCYINSALSFETLVQVLYTGIALFLLGRYPPIIKMN